jgi:NADPH:quinone reductase-like Zn-dependent oxidoreductase
LSDEEAAALPLVGLTAYQALVEVGGVGPGRRVLVQAAGGGVGHVAVQMAKALGTHGIATPSPRKEAFGRKLAADEIIDYTSSDLGSAGTADLVIDPFGGAATLRALEVVRRGGVLAVLVGQLDHEVRAAAHQAGVRLARIGVVPNAASLGALVDLVERGLLRPTVAAAYPLDQAGAAHGALAQGPEGKIVLVP